MSQLGKRYHCEKCGAELQCAKAGKGVPECFGNAMKLREPKPLLSSD